MRQQKHWKNARSKFFAFCVGMAALGTLRCGGDSDEGASIDGTKMEDPCTTVYKDLCGTDCEGDDDCSDGLHCNSDGTCGAECGPGSSLCAAGLDCSSNGFCSSSGSGTGGKSAIDVPMGGNDSSGGSDPGAGGACPSIDLELGDVTPTVALLIDRSGSMTDEEFEPGGPNRWVALKEALLGDESVIRALESKVRFGFVWYGNDTDNDICPDLLMGDDDSLMPPALNAFDAFDDYYTPLDTIPNTPTGESIHAVREMLENFDEPGPKYIVLATDGDPDHCGDPDDGDGEAKPLVVAEVTSAYDDADITTFVISVGGDVAEEHLHDVANVGQGFPTDDAEDRFYKVTTQDSLAAAFDEIIAGTRNCELELNGEIDPDRADEGVVTLDGEEVPLDDDNGWRVIDSKTIELVGEYCDDIKTGVHELSANFSCEAVVVPPVPK